MDKKICVIGAGRWGKNHIKTLHSLGCLGGIVDSNSKSLASFAEMYPDAQVYSHYRDAMKAGFDGFTVATPAETHYIIAKDLLENGNHVLVEKPIALSVKDAVELKAIADRNNLKLMVGHVLLFHPAIQAMKAVIKEGKIGRLQYLYSNRLNLGTVRTEENILWSFAPHDISVFQYLIEERPLSIFSEGGAFLQSDIHDTTMTILKYPKNIVGHIFVSWLNPFKEQRLVVIGSKGMLSYDDSSSEKELLFYEKGIDWINGEPVKRDGATESIPYERKMPLTEEMKYFRDHLDEGKITIADSQNAVEVLEVLEQATKSLLQGSG